MNTEQPIDMTRIAAILAAPDSAIHLFAYLHAGLLRDVGSGLTTASVYDLDAMRGRRVYTDNAEAYPVGNFKRLERNRFYDTVIEAGQVFATTRIEEIAEVFFDWQKIQGLGFGSNLNLPAIADGQVIGTVNLLAPSGHYSAPRIAAALRWQPVATLCFLLLARGNLEIDSFIGQVAAPAAGPVMEGA